MTLVVIQPRIQFKYNGKTEHFAKHLSAHRSQKHAVIVRRYFVVVTRQVNHAAKIPHNNESYVLLNSLEVEKTQLMRALMNETKTNDERSAEYLAKVSSV